MGQKECPRMESQRKWLPPVEVLIPAAKVSGDGVHKRVE